MKTEISMPKIMRGVTITATATGVKRTHVRVLLGCKIMALAAAVMGCNVDVELRG